MRTRFIAYLETLHSNYWFVPTLMLGLSIILAFGMIRLDELVQLQNNPSTWVYGGGPAGESPGTTSRAKPFTPH